MPVWKFGNKQKEEEQPEEEEEVEEVEVDSNGDEVEYVEEEVEVTDDGEEEEEESATPVKKPAQKVVSSTPGSSVNAKIQEVESGWMQSRVAGKPTERGAGECVPASGKWDV